MDNKSDRNIKEFSMVMDELDMEGILDEMQDRGRLLSWGYSSVDKIQQLRSGRTYLIGARPKMGKTTTAINLAVRMAVEKDLKVVFFTNNLTAMMVAERMLGILAGVPFETIKLHEFRPGEWESIVDAAKQLEEANIVINDKPNVSVDEIDRLLSEVSYQDTDVVIFDEIVYGEQGDNKPRGNNESDSMGQLSQSVKRLAAKHGVAIIGFCSLGRQVEKKRSDFRPSLYMGDLKDGWSPNWDTVAFLYRDEYYHRDSGMPGIMEFKIDKSFHRAEPETVLLKWDRMTLRIGE